ncbi:hypothetical protein [Streptomyces sp. NPDC091217]|uniref:hypothetical protein n=1 Tax=Streptomyces sp. NPDC091217 TaxID=3365975 RepID=UPI0038071F13
MAQDAIRAALVGLPPAVLLDFAGVLAQLRTGGAAGDRLADPGVDRDDDQGAVQGLEFRPVGDGLHLLRGSVCEGDLQGLP